MTIEPSPNRPVHPAPGITAQEFLFGLDEFVRAVRRSEYAVHDSHLQDQAVNAMFWIDELRSILAEVR